jgi:SAM-dependent methyltransferase
MELTSWAVDRPVNSAFALPQGFRGRLAGRFMLWNDGKQSDVVRLLDPRPGSRVLEVGFGPGGLIRRLVARTEVALVCGVDPSTDMVAAARRRNRAGAAAGRLELRTGTAAETGYPDGHFDHVVSVRNVALWPDLEAGLRELHRVVRPQGTVLISWHGGTDPNRIVRNFRLPDDKLARIQDGLTDLFTSATRHELTMQTAFLAVR